MKYIVGFSGGIDSTYVAWYLKKLGHTVKLVHLKITPQPNKCCFLPHELYEIAYKLDIPLEIVDCSEDFHKYVITDFINKYCQAYTPNPCINCNEYVRFQYLNQIREKYNYDFCTTGHYAKIINYQNMPYLAQPSDLKKDQTYMLYRIMHLKNSQNNLLLNNIQFILTDITKNEIKENILKYQIPFISIQESQNICFIPDDDYPGFIRQNCTINYGSGKVYDLQGHYLAEHKGIIYYTVGQRFVIPTLSHAKLYVLKKEINSNSIIVGNYEDLATDNIILTRFISTHLLFNLGPQENLFAKIRSHQELQIVNILEKLNNNNYYQVTFASTLKAPASGQHCVLYRKINEDCLVVGGGMIITL